MTSFFFLSDRNFRGIMLLVIPSEQCYNLLRANTQKGSRPRFHGNTFGDCCCTFFRPFDDPLVF